MWSQVKRRQNSAEAIVPPLSGGSLFSAFEVDGPFAPLTQPPLASLVWSRPIGRRPSTSTSRPDKQATRSQAKLPPATRAPLVKEVTSGRKSRRTSATLESDFKHCRPTAWYTSRQRGSTWSHILKPQEGKSHLRLSRKPDETAAGERYTSRQRGYICSPFRVKRRRLPLVKEVTSRA